MSSNVDALTADLDIKKLVELIRVAETGIIFHALIKLSIQACTKSNQ